MNRRLLILDDEPGILVEYQNILCPVEHNIPAIRSSRQLATAPAAQPVFQPFEITCVADGNKALMQIKKSISEGHNFVGGFFDVKLGGGIDGIETIRLAKELDPDLLCVIVTAYQDRNIDDIQQIFGDDYADRWDFLAKPFANAEILQKACALVKHWERRIRERAYLKQIQDQQEQLIRAERMAAIGTLARGIGHEFGNILFAMLGKAELALQSKKPAEMQKTLEGLVTALERSGIIVRNLQSMVKLEVKKSKFNIAPLIDELLSLLVHEFKKHRITVTKDIDATLPEITANKVELGQAFLNIFINAIHAMEGKEGKLELRAKTESGKIIVEVEDNGCGISAENLGRIFEPLFTTKGERGTGIGLSVCKKIIGNHGGNIRVSSTPSEGTIFTIVLPL